MSKKKAKLELEDLKVQSFITMLKPKELRKLLGGDTDDGCMPESVPKERCNGNGSEEPGCSDVGC